MQLNKNRETLAGIIGSSEGVNTLEAKNPEDFKQALEKIHLLEIHENTHTQLDSLKNDINKTPEQKLNVILNNIKSLTPENKSANNDNIKGLIQEKKDESIKQLQQKASENLPFLGIGEKLFDIANNIFNPKNTGEASMLEKILGWIGSTSFGKKIGLGIMSFLGIGKGYEQVVGLGIDNMVTPEKIDVVKSGIQDSLSQYIHVPHEQINKVLDNKGIFTDEKILSYYEQIKSGKGIKFNDLIRDFKSVDPKNILGGAKENVENEGFELMKSQIQTQYDKELTPEKSDKLKELMQQHFGKKTRTRMQEISANRKFQFKDFYETIGNSIGFMFSLIVEGIIDTDNMIWNMVDNSSDIVNVSFGLLPFTSNIAVDDLVQKIGEMAPAQRGLFIGLLYRKGGLLLDAMGSVSSASTRLLLDAVLPANTGVDGIKLFTDSFRGAEKQIDNLAKIEAAITGTKINPSTQEFKTAMINNLSDIKNNAEIIELLKKYDGTEKSLEAIKASPLIKHKIHGQTIKDFNDLRQVLSKKMKTKFHDTIGEFTGSRVLKEQFVGIGKNTQMQKFDRVLSDISANQARIVKNKLDLGMFKKFTDSLEMAKISNVSDRLLFELRSKDDAKAFMKQMNTLAQKSPDLIKGFFSKLPIISVVGLSMADEKPFVESIQKEIKYLIPILGPIWMIGEGGVSWEKGYPEIIDPLQTGIAGGLLALDGYFGYKAARSGKFLKFIGKPVTDIIDIGKGSVKWGRAIYKTGRVLPSSSKSTFARSLKNLAGGPKKRIMGILVALAATMGISNIAQAEGIDQYKKEDGKMDTEKIKADIDAMNNKEKMELIQLFFTDEVKNNMVFRLEGDTLHVESNTPEVRSDWFIDDSVRENLSTLLNIVHIKVSSNH